MKESGFGLSLYKKVVSLSKLYTKNVPSNFIKLRTSTGKISVSSSEVDEASTVCVTGEGDSAGEGCKDGSIVVGKQSRVVTTASKNMRKQ